MDSHVIPKKQLARLLTCLSCILENKTPFTPGEERLQDQKVMEAIYQSAREGKPVKLAAVTKKGCVPGDRAERELA